MVEESVRQAIERGQPGIAALKMQRLRLNLERQLDKIYQMPHGEEQEAAFRATFWGLFVDLGLAFWIPDWLGDFPHLRADLKRILVQRPMSAGQEGAELWESQEQRGRGIASYLVIMLLPAQMRRPEMLRQRLLPRLMQAEDRLVPEFGFRHEDLRRGTQAAQEQFGDVYDRLWELSARVRLHDRGLLEGSDLRMELDRLGAVELLAAPCRQTLHDQLLDLTRRASGRTLVEPAGAGGRCRLCRFPTTDWASVEVLAGLRSTICADFEGWVPEDGCCSHCAERYELLVGSGEVLA